MHFERVGILVNINMQPIPAPKRCLRLAGVLRESIERDLPAGARAVVLGTGGLSHWLNVPGMGTVNTAFDRKVLDLFADLNQRLGVAYLFITHDLTVARAITDEVMVMHEGRIVEEGDTHAILDNPRSDAGKALVAAAPDLKRALARRLEKQD